MRPVSATADQPERVWAVRGAVQAERNDADAIIAATEELMRELLERNAIEPDRAVSCFFTATDDLDAEFPAVAARRLGLDRVPLMCGREMPVAGSLERVIRVLVHYYAAADHVPAHAYLGAASELRGDLESAQ
jgi:chorismate mutase